MMFGEMLGAITSLVGIGLQAQAQEEQKQIAWAQLRWQQQRARDQDRFAQAARFDAYGNETMYDPITNEWKIQLTPNQKGIMQAGEKEQTLQLTKDAPAARKIREAVQARSKMAQEPYNKAAVAYQYSEAPSEASIRSDLGTLMATNMMARGKADQALLMRSAARLGTGAKAEEIINAVDQDLGDQTKNMQLQARQQALKEYGDRANMREQILGAPLKYWGDIMSQGGNIPNMPTNYGPQSELAQSMAQQAQAIQRSMATGDSAINQAYSGVEKAVGQSPSFSGLAGILSKMKLDGGTKSDDTGTTGGTGFNMGGFSLFPQNVPGWDDRSSSGWG